MMVVCLLKFTLYVQNFCLFFFSQEFMIALVVNLVNFLNMNFATKINW